MFILDIYIFLNIFLKRIQQKWYIAWLKQPPEHATFIYLK